MTEEEYQIFRDRARNLLVGEGAEDLNTKIMKNKDSRDQITSAQEVKRNTGLRNMGFKDKPQFKRKRAKVSGSKRNR